MSKNDSIAIIGGGLAGCEAAWQLLNKGHSVSLYEMKSVNFSPAHRSSHLAELVCSNSLRSNIIENAAGTLKEEMRRMNSLIMSAADATSVPAGRALAVDRRAFSKFIEKKMKEFPKLTIIRQEVTDIPADGLVIIATGPLTSDSLSQSIAGITGNSYLYFYDAISPSLKGIRSITKKCSGLQDMMMTAKANILNCSMGKEEYELFWKTLTEGQTVPLRDFEDYKYFEGAFPLKLLQAAGSQRCFSVQ